MVDLEQSKRTAWGNLAKKLGNENRPARPVAKVVSDSKKRLGQSSDHVVTSRALTENLTRDLNRLEDDEEILLDCILDSLAKEEVFKNPQRYALLAPEIQRVVNEQVVTMSLLPIRAMSADEFRSKTGLKTSDKEFENLFRRLARSARLSGKFKSYLVKDAEGKTRYVELEIVERPLFPDGLMVMRYGEASRRTSIPEDSKMKRVVFYKLHSPSVLLLQDGIARGRFGAFPKELYASKWNWPALRIARYYDRYSGTYKGVDFHYRGLEALLGLKPVADVTQRIQQFDRYFEIVEKSMGTQPVIKRFRGQRTCWTLKPKFLLPVSKVNRKSYGV